MDQVWILTTGDYCDPSTILGTYATRELGLTALGTAFLTLGGEKQEPIQCADGSVHINGTLDFLELEPHTVQRATAAQPAIAA